MNPTQPIAGSDERGHAHRRRPPAGCGSAGAAGGYGRHEENATPEFAPLLQLAFPSRRPQPPGKRPRRFPQPLGKLDPTAGRLGPVSHRSTASTITRDQYFFFSNFLLTLYRGTDVGPPPKILQLSHSPGFARSATTSERIGDGA